MGCFYFAGCQAYNRTKPINHVGVTPYKNVFERMVQKYDKKTVRGFRTFQGTG